jgi:hypothetical protein
MKSASGILGVALTWLGSMVWCSWILWGGRPLLALPLAFLGAILVFVATIRTEDWKPLALWGAAIIPPLILDVIVRIRDWQ